MDHLWILGPRHIHQIHQIHEIHEIHDPEISIAIVDGWHHGIRKNACRLTSSGEPFPRSMAVSLDGMAWPGDGRSGRGKGVDSGTSYDQYHSYRSLLIIHIDIDIDIYIYILSIV